MKIAFGWEKGNIYMKEIKDYYGNILKDGDTISMPHIMEDGYKNKIIHGYYITKLKYDPSRDCLVTEDDMGISFAYGIVKINI